LPGPAELWPDDPAYFYKHGFEVRPDRADRHRKALHLLAEITPPAGWMDEVVHENDQYELIWHQGHQLWF
jgi:hypothetical protein